MTDISAIGPKELTAHFNRFNYAHWVTVRCEVSIANKATAAVAEVSKTIRILTSNTPTNGVAKTFQCIVIVT